MLTRLQLTNFKNFKKEDLRLGPITLLIGTNAAGKSNIRDAFRFLHGVSRGYSVAEIIGEKYGDGGFLQWRGIRGGTRETTFRNAQTFRLEVSFEADGRFGKYGIEVDTGNASIAPKVVWERLETGHTKWALEAMFDSHPAYDPVSSSNDPDHLPVRLKKSGTQRKYGDRVDCLNFRPALSQIADGSKTRITAVRDAANWALKELESIRFLDLDPEALRRPSFPGQIVLGDKGDNLSSVLQEICTKPPLRAALASWVEELTPMDATDFEFPSDHTGRILVTLVERDGSRVSANSASDGTLRFLAMIAALLGPESSKVYFFEELDNGIHPARLHLLLNLIEQHVKTNKVQIIATSHSPELLTLLNDQARESASLVYRLPHSAEGHIRPIVDLPGARDLFSRDSDLAHLHATGWFEDVAYFGTDEEPEH